MPEGNKTRARRSRNPREGGTLEHRRMAHSSAWLLRPAWNGRPNHMKLLVTDTLLFETALTPAQAECQGFAGDTEHSAAGGVASGAGCRAPCLPRPHRASLREGLRTTEIRSGSLAHRCCGAGRSNPACCLWRTEYRRPPCAWCAVALRTEGRQTCSSACSTLLEAGQLLLSFSRPLDHVVDSR